MASSMDETDDSTRGDEVKSKASSQPLLNRSEYPTLLEQLQSMISSSPSSFHHYTTSL
jgi:hypothetical protein